MLSIMIKSVELFDEASQEFIRTDDATLNLEHSLVSLSKWESKWEKPFLNDKDKTTEETLDYIRCMDLNDNTPNHIYSSLSQENVDAISKYIDAKMTATWFNESQIKTNGVGNREIITAEIIYYWMIALNVPFECQHWHLNRLLTLIKVCNQKNAPAKKMGRQELNARNRALNEARRAKLNTTG